MYQIERNVSIPTTATNSLRKVTYPFRQMEVGDSILVKGNEAEQMKAINSARSLTKIEGDERYFIFDRTKDAVRIWRIDNKKAPVPNDSAE